MQGEGKRQDFKLTFDSNDPAGLLELVKDILAFANSGGGSIVFGRNETDVPGLPPTVAEALDSSRIGDAVDKHTEKGLIHVSHAQQLLPNGSLLVTLTVEVSPYPAVVSRDATLHSSGKKQQTILRRGDVWVRHGSRTERMSQADMRNWIDHAYEKGVDKVMSAAQVVRDAGPTRSIELRTPQGEAFRTPSDLLDDALRRKALGLPHLLTGRELLWAFAQRRFFHPTDEQLELLVESAMRRPVTLHWWLIDPRVDHEMVARLLDRLTAAQDRDKSDAAKSAVELAAIYLDPEKARQVLNNLRSSRYTHFRNAASRYAGAKAIEDGLRSRITRRTTGGRKFDELNVVELENLADELASGEMQSASQARARNLSDTLVALWLKASGNRRRPRR